MSRLHERWEIFWFEQASPVNLGFCRILFFGALFALYLPQDFVAWAEVSPVFWKPIGLFRRLHLPVLSAPLLAVIQAFWKVTLGLSCIGLFTRCSTVTSFILGVYLLGLPYNFGLLSHSNAILVLVLGIMALSHCGDSWSVDQLLRRGWRRGEPSVSHPLISGEYTLAGAGRLADHGAYLLWGGLLKAQALGHRVDCFGQHGDTINPKQLLYLWH